MAEFEDLNQNINININETGATEAEQSIDKLNTSIDENSKSQKKQVDAGKQVEKTFKDVSKTFEQVYGDLKPLTTRMGEAEDRLYELALAGQQASTEYKELLVSVANYRKTQIETDRTVDAAATTLGQKLGGAAQLAGTGISFATSGMALFGDQSEDTEKALLKVQAAMAFADSIRSLSEMKQQFGVFKDLVVSGYARIIAAKQAEVVVTTEATIAQRLLNTAVLSNPYIAAAAAIAAITVVTYAWIKSSEKQEIALEDSADALSKSKLATDNLSSSIEDCKTVTDGFNRLEIARAKALGATDVEIQKLIQSQKDLAVSSTQTFSTESFLNYQKARAATSKAIKTGDEELIEEAKKNQEAANEVYRKSNEDFNNAIITAGENRLNNQATNLEKQKDLDKKEIEGQKSKNKELQAERVKAAEEARAKANQEAQDQGKIAENKFDAALKLNKDTAKANADALLTENELALQAENEAYVKKLDALVEFNFSTEEVEAEHKRNLAAINDEYFAGEADKAIERSERQKEILEAELQQKEDIQAAEFNLADKAIGFFNIIAGKNKAVQKASMIAEGAISIGKQVASNNTANAGALTTPQAILTSGASAVPVIAFNNISTGLGIAATVASTAKALSAVGGGGGVSGSGSNGGSSPTRNVAQVGFQSSSENQISSAIAQQQKEQPPIKAFVVSQEVTDSQELERKKLLNNGF